MIDKATSYKIFIEKMITIHQLFSAPEQAIFKADSVGQPINCLADPVDGSIGIEQIFQGYPVEHQFESFRDSSAGSRLDPLAPATYLP